jgi:hypothetical protein
MISAKIRTTSVMSSERKVVLWLDDYFDSDGGLTTTGSSDLELVTDYEELKREHPDVIFVPVQTIEAFVGHLIDFARLKNGLKPRGKIPLRLDCLVVDLMIDLVESIRIPETHPGTKEINFASDGSVVKWQNDPAESVEVGFQLISRMVNRTAHLRSIPVIFYTHRSITPSLESEVASLGRAGAVEALSKGNGFKGLSASLRAMGV